MATLFNAVTGDATNNVIKAIANKAMLNTAIPNKVIPNKST